jgi:MoaA/NifB/PqqE/SkfB family radical SAM enzyme
MKLSEKISIFNKIAQAVLFKKKYPLIAAWNITYRCNCACKYCGIKRDKDKREKLNTGEVIGIINQLSQAGVKFINFGGGEPLIRDDFEEIVDFCNQKEIYVGVISNGILAGKKIKILEKVNKIQLSLDGPREINDFVRGKGVYDKVIETINLCKRNNIRVGLITVISKYNVADIAAIVDISKQYGVEMHVQPATSNLSGDSKKDVLESPLEKDYKNALQYLIDEKRKGNHLINHSISGLKQMYDWPKARKINCFASLLFFNIEPDGRIFVCNMFPEYQKYLIPIEDNFKETFYKLKLPHCCSCCWNSSMVEFNLMGNLRVPSFLEIAKKL